RAQIVGKASGGAGAVVVRMGDGTVNPSSNTIHMSASGVSRGLIEWLGSNGSNVVDISPAYLPTGGVAQIGTGNTGTTSSDTVRLSGYVEGSSRFTKLGGPADGRAEIGLQATASAIGARAWGENVAANAAYSEARGRNTSTSGVDSEATGNGAVTYHRGARARSSGTLRAAGDRQHYDAHWFGETVDAVQTELMLGGPTTTNRFFIDTNRYLAGTIRICGVQVGGSAIRITREFKFTLLRQSGAAVLTVTPTTIEQTDVALDCVAQLDGTSTYLSVLVTGKASVRVAWDAWMDASFIRMVSP
ncbi:hypothetical protein, partial [Pseudoroseomonas ludipueritiae]